ncbi:hypothetical protein EAI26_07815 [Lactobacillus sp. 0.1XD8-4]|uniref:PepSY domain-containing protein n=1 Tax=Limosilactobacillus walteri TaxID=2268022 RepID=A0ABR8P951_9LACO|nr:PepSY domain-containing protein [Limosilactobacillus walteri]MBD5807208.1 hypothetical protein [Limosilactobacillus walteri]MRN07291.1 hypothetical protein [Lactobacillus sp. 0.1XD8-4]
MNASNNSLNPWIIPVTLGASGIAGFIAGKLFGNRQVSADRILKLVKNDFASEGAVTGSWINDKAIPFQRFAVKTDAYEGGISRLEDGEKVEYEFVADAYTGSLLELKRIEND